MKIKEVKFQISMEGSGLVNFDSGDQKHLWNRESKNGNKNKFTSIDNNNVYGKKSFIRLEDNSLGYDNKISAECLRNSIFRGDAIAINPSISHHKSLLYQFIGSVLGLIRGYVFAGDETIKRKSPLTIIIANKTNNAESCMEFHARSGQKKKNDDSGKSDTTVYNKETIGDITYQSRGFINIQNLEFLSCDPIHDKYAFNPDDYNILKFYLSKSLPNFNSDLGYYSLKTAQSDAPEYGVKLTNEQIVYLIKETLKRILNIKILRATAYAKVDSLKVELVTDLFNSKNNQWFEIKSEEDIDNLQFEVEEYYVLSDESEAKKLREEAENLLKEKIKNSEEKKKSKKITQTHE
jgi:hypothetical protein